MSTIQQYRMNCKTFREQLTEIENHIKNQKIYTSFDFGKLHSNVAGYEVWPQANAGAIDAALKPKYNS
jgi:hypothetical protein